MCRIAGIINPALPVSVLKERVQTMCHTLRHGGPDDEGIYTDEDHHLILGHRRLSLIDLSEAGHQPMIWDNGKLVITYNGELYNYLELKKQLKDAGYSFTSQSDTEVILAAFACWGTNAFKYFNGMFAFALWDRLHQKVYLVRDASGIKPVYYSTINNSLIFASEVRAFGHLPEFSYSNNTWPVLFMAYGHIPEPVTTLKHVTPLPKGFFLQYNVVSKSSDLVSFSHYSYIEKLENRTEALQNIRYTLRKAIERHLLSDAPIGAFLSGGIDSSIVALLAGSVVKKNLNTLSIYFNKSVYSEKKYQDIIVNQLQCNHFGHLLSGEEFEAFFPRILKAMDLPSSDGINTWFISRYAKENGLKAVLSGLGGDELFGGYPSFQRIKTVRFLQQLPNSSLKAGRYSFLQKFRRITYLSLPGIKGSYLFLRGQFIPSEIACHLNMEEKQVWKILEEQPTLPDINYLTHKNQASWMEMNLYMQNQLLRDSDVMSMAHGVEIRVPFLDAELVKLVLQIRSDVKYEGEGKQLLIDAFKTELPEAIYNRPKMGFALPFKEWLSQSEFVKELMVGADKNSTKTYKLFLEGKRHWSQLMTLLLAKHYQYEKASAFSYA